MLELLQRQVLFVGGKGGVGKSTIATAIAVAAAKRGKRSLLVSTDPAHSLGDLFGRPIGDRETDIGPGLFALEIDADTTAERYLDSVKASMRDLVRPALYATIDRQMELARLAPGTSESAMLQRMSNLMLDATKRYDLLIFDTAPTGHTLRLLALPELMADWTEGLLSNRQRSAKLARAAKHVGSRSDSRRSDELSYLSDPTTSIFDRGQRIGEILRDRALQFRDARNILLDNRRSGFVLVVIPEKLPVAESKKTVDQLRQHKIETTALIINRLLPKDITGTFMRQRLAQQAHSLEEIEQTFRSIAQFQVPLLPKDIHGIKSLEQIGDRLLSIT